MATAEERAAACFKVTPDGDDPVSFSTAGDCLTIAVYDGGQLLRECGRQVIAAAIRAAEADAAARERERCVAAVRSQMYDGVCADQEAKDITEAENSALQRAIDAIGDQGTGV